MNNENIKNKTFVNVYLEQGINTDYLISFSMNNHKFHSEYIRVLILGFYKENKQIIDELYELNKSQPKEINKDSRVYSEYGSVKNVRFGFYLDPETYSILNKICIGFNRQTSNMINIIIKCIINKNTEDIDRYYIDNKNVLHELTEIKRDDEQFDMLKFSVPKFVVDKLYEIKRYSKEPLIHIIYRIVSNKIEEYNCQIYNDNLSKYIEMYFVIRDLEDTKAISEINPASSMIDYNKIANKIKYTINKRITISYDLNFNLKLKKQLQVVEKQYRIKQYKIIRSILINYLINTNFIEEYYEKNKRK